MLLVRLNAYVAWARQRAFMMRFAFIMLLSLICLSAKASSDPKEANLNSSVSHAPEASAALEASTGDQPGDELEKSKPVASVDPEAGVTSPEQSVSKQSSLPLKKVSVSEASNWPFVLLTLLAMIICILLIAWIVKRFSGLSGLGGRDLKITSAIAVGSRERVAVVEVKGEQFLIGVTPHNISLLHHFSEEELIAAKAKSVLEQSKAPSAFADKLQSILKQGSTADSESK